MAWTLANIFATFANSLMDLLSKYSLLPNVIIDILVLFTLLIIMYLYFDNNVDSVKRVYVSMSKKYNIKN